MHNFEYIIFHSNTYLNRYSLDAFRISSLDLFYSHLLSYGSTLLDVPYFEQKMCNLSSFSKEQICMSIKTNVIQIRVLKDIFLNAWVLEYTEYILSFEPFFGSHHLEYFHTIHNHTTFSRVLIWISISGSITSTKVRNLKNFFVWLP